MIQTYVDVLETMIRMDVLDYRVINYKAFGLNVHDYAAAVSMNVNVVRDEAPRSNQPTVWQMQYNSQLFQINFKLDPTL